MKCSVTVLGVLLAWFSLALAEQPVSRRNMHERVYAVVEMVGSGKPGDPRRPLYAPLPPSPGSPVRADGITGFTYVLSDDGKYALVEFVGRDRAAFREMLADPRVKVFEKDRKSVV